MRLNVASRTGYAGLVALSLGVAVYALVAYALLPLGAVVHPDMRAGLEAQRAALYAHVFASVLALALGPFQFSARLRSRRLALHRWCGRVYLGVGVFVGGIAGLYMALHSAGGPVARVGFACLALAWLYTGLRAYRAVRERDLASHRIWMIRNFALTFAAVTLRLWLPATVVAGAPFGIAYPVVAWLCWVPNLAVAELTFVARREKRSMKAASRPSA